MYRKFIKLLSFFMALAVLFSVAAPVSAQPNLKPGKGGQVEESSNGVYIVQMLNDPVVAYKGEIQGLKATKPKAGQKIDVATPAVVNYVAYLDGKQNDALNKVGGQKIYSYYYSFNGFAARMSLDQANKIAGVDGVLVVSPDQLYSIDTSSTPSFLGLDAPGGLWDQLGGFDSAGEDIVIGVIDSGIWPESASFSDRTGANGNESQDGKLDYQQIPGWNAKCSPGEDFSASDCNQKLIGAQWFNEAWGGDAAVESERPWEFMSARDYNGHGTHTSSTAGGNHGVVATGPAAVFGNISGMAPHARISMYKALWSTEDGSTASGFTADLVASRGAIVNRAVVDLLDEVAEKEGIECTTEAAGRATGTDADVVHLSRTGVPTAVVSIPLRYMHSPVEMVDLADVEGTIKLLTALALRLEADTSLARW